jgi:hypothetical protein
VSDNETAGSGGAEADRRDSHAGFAEGFDNIVAMTLPQGVRVRLPNRRKSESVVFVHEGHRYTASISRFGDGSIAEIFLDGAKFGSDTAVNAADSAILASLALQSGVSVEAIRAAVRGPIATALAMFDGFEIVRA